MLIYSVPARTIHPRFVLANSVQHFLCVPFLLAFPVQFSYQFLLRSFLSSIFPQSQSLSLSLSVSQSPLYDFPSSIQASRSLHLYISVQSMPQGHHVRFIPFSPSLAVSSVLFSLLSLPHGLFSSILPVSLCLSVLLPVLFPVPLRPHARSGLVSVQHCR